jgi:hypothetical protein
VFNQQSVVQSNDVRNDPIAGEPMAGEPPMQNYEITLCDRHRIFVSGRGRQSLCQFKQTFAALCDVGTMLNVLGRPKRLCGSVISVVEEHVKSLEYECFVLAAQS